MGIIDYLVHEDGLVLTEGAFPVRVSGLVGILEGVAGRLGWVGQWGCPFVDGHQIALGPWR